MAFCSRQRVAVLSPLFAAMAVSFHSGSAHSAGYGIYENSASYMGTAFAGKASNPQDASIAANNPAGIAFVEGTQISVGSAVIFKGGEFEGKHTRPNPLPRQPDITVAEGKTKDFQSTTWVPFGHFVIPVNEQLSFGLSGYGPYGIELDYDKDWAGRYFGNKTSVKTINLQGIVSYKFQEDFSVGFGLIGSYVKGKLTQKTDLTNFMIPDQPAAEAKVDGDAETLGWTLGALWKVNEKTNLGLAYFSQLEFKLKGDVKADGTLLGQPVNKKSKGKLDITMPEKAALSLTHHLNDQWAVMAEATWTRWSRFEEFYVRADDPAMSSFVPINWKDVWAWSFGASWQVMPEWQLRAGYMFDQSPVDDKNRTARTPDADRNWFTLGANWKPDPKFSIDLSYAYVSLKKGKINETQHNPPGVSPDVVDSYGALTGEYNNSSNIVAAQLNYIF
ncbi:OmpP1/FadL family transporter [Endozoicomonas arenosclerae]|uniref:OmpP1/FadL family transporter n=1 Tax=Endozoicomonas arenosclerae TaxID=1633495 RepID=UPI0009A22178|nr:outer membrane protein transport protein [Endozoicomonas arenosclerae]